MVNTAVGPPPPVVLAAYGLAGTPVRLGGGRGRSWRVGGAVVKPLDMEPQMLPWQAGLLARLSDRADFRVSVPLRTSEGLWTAHGWTAWRHQPGAHARQRWQDIVAVGRRLHAALEGEPEPAFLRDRADRWAIADRVAWGELPATRFAGTRHLPALVAALEPLDLQPQLVHGDLTGNVLFHDHLPPLVIDFSPYWRPPAYASAVVVADALVFEGAGEEILQPLFGEPHFAQCLLRALIFRAVTDYLAGRHPSYAGDPDRYRSAVELAIGLATQ